MTRRLSDETFLGRLLPTSARQQSYRQDTLLALFPRIHQGLSPDYASDVRKSVAAVAKTARFT
jgi:hypothetical protein